MEETPVEHRPGTTRAGRHRRRPGRHAAPRRPLLTAASMRTALRAVAAAMLIAAVIDLTFPRATSNASVGRPAAPAAVDVRSVARLSAITQIAQVNRPRICPIDWRQSTWHVKRLIRCAAEHHDLSQRRALYIAWRESRYQAQAFNRAGPAAGIYQHLLRYWPDRARTYGFPDWSPFNARANIFVTMRMVKDHGWAPWAL